MALSADQIVWINRTKAMTGVNSGAGNVSASPEAGGPLAPPPAPGVSFSIGEQLRTAVQTFLGSFTELPISGENWEVSYGGKTARLTQEARDKAVDDLCGKLAATMEDGFARVAWAEMLYAEQKKVDAEWWLTSHVVHIFGRVSDPGPLLKGAAERARAHHSAALTAKQSRDLEALALAVTDCLAAAKEAELLAKAYFEGTVGSAELKIKVLEGVVTASKYTLLALSVIASGGASAAAAGAIAGVANTTIDTVEDLGMGKKVDWAKVTVSLIMEIVMLRYGEGLEEALNEEVAKRLVKAGARVSERIITKVCTEVVKAAMSNAAQGALRALAGKEVTNEEVAKEAVKDLASPGSLATEVLKALRELALLAKAAA